MSKKNIHKTPVAVDDFCSEILTPVIPTPSKRSRLNEALRENLRKRKNQARIRKLDKSLNENLD